MIKLFFFITGLLLIILAFYKIEIWYPWNIFIGLGGYAVILITIQRIIIKYILK